MAGEFEALGDVIIVVGQTSYSWARLSMCNSIPFLKKIESATKDRRSPTSLCCFYTKSFKIVTLVNAMNFAWEQ